MPDWRHFIRGHLAPLTLGAERELEIIEELSQHLEAAYEDALRDGASEHDALKRATAQIPDWRLLECELSRDQRPIARQPATANSKSHEKGWILMETLRRDLLYGWRMLLSALGLAAVGVLLLAAVRPQGLATYSRVVSVNGPRSAVLLVGHHALLLPNQSFLVVAPSMGGCTSVSGPGGTVPLVCPGTLPALDDPGLVAAVARGDVARPSAPNVPTRSMPAGYSVFLLVPAIATVGGGRWAGRTGRGRSSGRERALRGAGAGVVFAVLMGAGTWMAVIDVGLMLNATTTPALFTLGASPVGTASLALVWGVVGGALGALLVGGQDEGTPVPVEPDEPVPPSPTSV